MKSCFKSVFLIVLLLWATLSACSKEMDDSSEDISSSSDTVTIESIFDRESTDSGETEAPLNLYLHDQAEVIIVVSNESSTLSKDNQSNNSVFFINLGGINPSRLYRDDFIPVSCLIDGVEQFDNDIVPKIDYTYNCTLPEDCRLDYSRHELPGSQYYTKTSDFYNESKDKVVVRTNHPVHLDKHIYVNYKSTPEISNVSNCCQTYITELLESTYDQTVSVVVTDLWDCEYAGDYLTGMVVSNVTVELEPYYYKMVLIVINDTVNLIYFNPELRPYDEYDYACIPGSISFFFYDINNDDRLEIVWVFDVKRSLYNNTHIYSYDSASGLCSLVYSEK